MQGFIVRRHHTDDFDSFIKEYFAVD